MQINEIISSFPNATLRVSYKPGCWLGAENPTNPPHPYPHPYYHPPFLRLQSYPLSTAPPSLVQADVLDRRINLQNLVEADRLAGFYMPGEGFAVSMVEGSLALVGWCCEQEEEEGEEVQCSDHHHNLNKNK